MYSVNEKIVYPGHGVTVVTQIINKTIINETLPFYELSFISKEITVLVPIKNFEQLGLRPLVNKKEINELLENFCLICKPIICHEGTINSWNKRNKNFQTKMRSGSIKDLGSVYVELKSLMAYKELSFGERAVLQQVEHLLAEEISIVFNFTIPEAIEKLNQQIIFKTIPNPEVINLLHT